VNKLHPDSLAGFAGHDPADSLGAVKTPIYQSSTYVFESAAQMKALFAYKNGQTGWPADLAEPMAYGRWNHPGLQTLEARLKVWDGGEDALVFSSGMAALSAAWMSQLRPGDVIMYSVPLYGGSLSFIQKQLSAFGIIAFPFEVNETADTLLKRLQSDGLTDKVKVIHVESPCNPHNLVFDFEVVSTLKKLLGKAQKSPIITFDNTYFGPIFQQPLQFGADLVIYSATKFIGGHSDVIAGACVGSEKLIAEIRNWRSQLGTTAEPFSCFLLLRSLETLRIRMEKAAENASKLAHFLNKHPKISQVHYPEINSQESAQYKLYKKYCNGPGSMISFDIDSDEAGAFRFLDALQLIRLAVSLGGTESLCTHPATTSHAPMTAAEKAHYGIGPAMIRFSVGLEEVNDLKNDLAQALEAV
jgi:methionine-gamma-lyase